MLADETVECGLCDLFADKQSQFYRLAVQGGFVVAPVPKVGLHLIDGFQNILWRDLSGAAFVLACCRINSGNTVVLVAVQPGVDGAPGELTHVAVLVEELHAGNVAHAFPLRFSARRLDRAEHTHFQIRCWIFHDPMPPWDLVRGTVP